MPKFLIHPETERRDCWSLGAQIFAAETAPFDLIIGIVRGGVPIAIYLHEYLMLKWQRPLGFAALRCKSYTGVDAAGAVQVGDLNDVWRELGDGKRILLVDDIFDRGQTIFAAREKLRAAAPIAVEIKTATLHYKPDNCQVPMTPDYYQQIFAGDQWIVYPAAINDVANEPENLRAMGL